MAFAGTTGSALCVARWLRRREANVLCGLCLNWKSPPTKCDKMHKKVALNHCDGIGKSCENAVAVSLQQFDALFFRFDGHADTFVVALGGSGSAGTDSMPFVEVRLLVNTTGNRLKGSVFMLADSGARTRIRRFKIDRFDAHVAATIPDVLWSSTTASSYEKVAKQATFWLVYARNHLFIGLGKSAGLHLIAKISLRSRYRSAIINRGLGALASRQDPSSAVTAYFGKEGPGEVTLDWSLSSAPVKEAETEAWDARSYSRDIHAIKGLLNSVSDPRAERLRDDALLCRYNVHRANGYTNIIVLTAKHVALFAARRSSLVVFGFRRCKLLGIVDLATIATVTDAPTFDRNEADSLSALRLVASDGSYLLLPHDRNNDDLQRALTYALKNIDRARADEASAIPLLLKYAAMEAETEGKYSNNGQMLNNASALTPAMLTAQAQPKLTRGISHDNIITTTNEEDCSCLESVVGDAQSSEWGTELYPLELTVSCHNLRFVRHAMRAASVVILQRPGTSGGNVSNKWKKVGQTETKIERTSPRFKDLSLIDPIGGNELRFVVYHCDSDKLDDALTMREIGSVELDLSDFFVSNTLQRPLKSSQGRLSGMIKIHAKPIRRSPATQNARELVQRLFPHKKRRHLPCLCGGRSGDRNSISATTHNSSVAAGDGGGSGDGGGGSSSSGPVENVGGGVVAREETDPDGLKGLIDVLMGADQAVLNEITSYICTDRPDIFQRARSGASTVVDIFTACRPHLYTVETKLYLIEAAAGSGPSLPIKQHFVGSLFLSTEGEDLYRLKDLFDIGEIEMDLSELIYSWITDDLQRTILLRWFRVQSDVVVRAREQRGAKRPLRVLSDIDDTLVHSGFGLGGPKFPAGTVLPGFVPLVELLGARVAFVTARPSFIDHLTYGTLREKYGIRGAVVLSGQLRDSLLVPIAANLSNKWISKRKFGNIERYMTVFSECSYLWFGDSGQGDALVGEKIMKMEGAHVAGVFITDVVQNDGVTFKTPYSERAQWREKGVDFVDNYLEVAFECHKRDLLSDEGLDEMASMTAKQVRAIAPRFRGNCYALNGQAATRALAARFLEYEQQLSRIGQCLESKVLIPRFRRTTSVFIGTDSSRPRNSACTIYDNSSPSISPLSGTQTSSSSTPLAEEADETASQETLVRSMVKVSVI